MFVMGSIKELTLLVALASSPILLANTTAQSATPTMKAVVIHEYGGPEVLKYEDIPRPEPKDDQLLIHVIAAGVNPVDGMIRSGMFDKGLLPTFSTTPATSPPRIIGNARFPSASTANQDFLKQLGADVTIDYTKEKFEDVAKDVDVVLDSIGGDTLARSYGVVKKGGIIVSLVARPK